MKGLSLFVFYLIAFLQPLHSQENKKYSEVIRLDSITSDKIYVTARNWFFENFKSSKDVINIDDKQEGQISGNGILTIYPIWKYMGEHIVETPVRFRMSIFVKDGKYKYEIMDLQPYDSKTGVEYGIINTSDNCPNTVPMISRKKMDEFWRNVKFETDKKVNDLINSLKQYMVSKSKSQENW